MLRIPSDVRRRSVVDLGCGVKAGTLAVWRVEAGRVMAVDLGGRCAIISRYG